MFYIMYIYREIDVQLFFTFLKDYDSVILTGSFLKNLSP